MLAFILKLNEAHAHKANFKLPQPYNYIDLVPTQPGYSEVSDGTHNISI